MGVVVQPAAARHSVASYFASFGPTPAWNDVCVWPPDVFALASLVLDHTEAYRSVVAPPSGRRWPPTPGWNDEVRAAAQRWRAAAGRTDGIPPLVRRHWAVVSARRSVSMATLADHWDLCEALLTLHAIADEACAGLAVGQPHAEFETQAWALLDQHGSLSRLPPDRVRVTPKTQFATRGITIRSLSRYLGLSYEAVEVRWRRIQSVIRDLGPTQQPRDYNILLLPWPLQVSAHSFHPLPGPLGNMDADAYGFFEFAPEGHVDLAQLHSLLDSSRRTVETIHAVVLPEAALAATEITAVEEAVAQHGVAFLCSGVRSHASGGQFGRNYLHVGVRTAEGWHHYSQSKHHRWRLDGPQIRQYHLTRQLNPAKQWWEAIDLPVRTLEIIDLGGGATTAPLVCEDLARMDEVTDLLCRIGPTLVIAVLLDGPQLGSRWAYRYASVLADEPGSAVLTLTSLGMATRSTPPGMKRSRVVALWNDPTGGLQELELARGAGGILITTSARLKTVWTADGRRHDSNTPDTVLSGVHQVRAGRAGRPRPAAHRPRAGARRV